MKKQIVNGTAPFTPRQAEYYKKLSGQDFPPGTTRQDASDLIDGFLTNNPQFRGRSLKQLQAGVVAKPKRLPPKPKPLPVPTKMTTIAWPPSPLPPIDPLCVPFAHMIPVMDDELKGFVPRQPYWDMTCDAHADGRAIQYVGPPGCGKSITPKALAHATQRPYLPISCDGKLNPRVLFGQINIKNGTSYFVEGEFTLLTQVPSIIVLEERNGLDGSVEMTFNRILNNRQFFIPEADQGKGKVYQLHKDCFIVQDCNPPGAKFTGANRQNVATVDRVSVINVQQLTHAEIVEILDGGPHDDKLADLYLQTNDAITVNGFRAAVTIRGLKRASALLAKGYSEKDAIELGLLNAIELTGGMDAKQVVEAIAKTKFKL
jgi:MoxR-like ATPase